ncbi:hypothetical protein [Orrella dioscoreae]|uniref:hypothetical protein n=1 Tax=Orrella dioscoreae TaxID=1851544 RepID=UPI00082EEAAA|nr:hypothetical protein [Orrella dioscoreae]
MAQYIAKERGQIPADDVQPSKRADSSPGRKVTRIVEKGEVFNFHGKPGKWMEPVKGGQTGKGGPGESTGRQGGRTQSGQTGQDGSQGQTSPDEKPGRDSQ